MVAGAKKVRQERLHRENYEVKRERGESHKKFWFGLDVPTRSWEPQTYLLPLSMVDFSLPPRDLGRTAVQFKSHIALQERLRWNTGSPGVKRQTREWSDHLSDRSIRMLDSREERIEGENEEMLSTALGPKSLSGNCCWGKASSISGHWAGRVGSCSSGKSIPEIG